MGQTYTDADIRRILGADVSGSDIVDRRIQEAYQRVRRMGRNRAVRRKAVHGFLGAAAAVMLAVTFCVANPSVASQIPGAGSLFVRLQGIFRFSGIPEDETVYPYETAEQADDADTAKRTDWTDSADTAESTDWTDDAGIAENLGTATDQGVTVTVTEYYASNQSISIGVRIGSADAFPKLAVTQAQQGNQLLQLLTEETYSFREAGDETVKGSRNLEGYLEDEHTFVGVMRIDYTSIKKDLRAYDAAIAECDARGEPYPENGALEALISEYEMPDHFQMQLDITGIRGYGCESRDYGNDPGSVQTFRIDGRWNMPSAWDVRCSDAGTERIRIEEKNEKGYGIDFIEVSPIEVTVHVYDTGNADCVAVLDRNGRPLAMGEDGQFSAYARDISRITVYICDFDKWVDLKSEAWRENKTLDEQLYAQLLEANALYKKTVDTADTIHEE